MASYNLIVDDVSLRNFAFSRKFSTAIEFKQIVEQKPKPTEFIAQKATQEGQPEISRAKGQESQSSNSWSLGIFWEFFFSYYFLYSVEGVAIVTGAVVAVVMVVIVLTVVVMEVAVVTDVVAAVTEEVADVVIK